jgi:hypothetical protein
MSAPNPWLSVPLKDYEGHMSSPGVQQLTVLAELFKCVLDYCRPESLALLGVAGGNGLEQIDGTVTRRIVGVDINQSYLDEVEQRFGPGRLAGLELNCVNLAQQRLSVAPVALVHAALIFEHAGLGLAFENAISLVTAGGHLAVVLQLPSEHEEGVAPTGYATIQALKKDFALIDAGDFQRLLGQRGFRLVDEQSRVASGGKTLWLGIFGRTA